MSTPASVVVGIGHALPECVVTNEELANRLNTSDEWIRTRTGIRERRVAAAGTTTADLAVDAARAALDSARREQVDVVVLATTTPDRRCPATAPEVASRLGLDGAAAFDLNAVCAGFLYAMATAGGLIASGVAASALVIGADRFTSLVDQQDRATACLFGDGAGAVVLRAGEIDEAGAVLAVELGSDGTQRDLITVSPDTDRLAMQGQAVYRHAVAQMTASTRAVLESSGWSVEKVDWFVAHQANQRILDAVAGRLGVEPGRVVSNIARVGNTAAASIPLALADAAADGRLAVGDRVALAAFGGGTTWGAATLTWPALTWPALG